MKKITFFTYFAFAVLFCLISSFSVSASGTLYHDEAKLVSETEAEYLEKLLYEIENTYDTMLLIAVVNDTGYQSAYSYAEDYLYSALGSKNSGAILLLSMEERDWAVYATGGARSVLSDYRIDSIMNIVVSDYFSRNDYFDGFQGFINQCTAYIIQAENEGIDVSEGVSYDDESLSLFSCILISLGIGAVAATVTVLILRGQLKSVKSARNATVYVDSGSFSLIESRDIFLYSTVTKTPKPQNNSSGSRSRSGGGRSGKF